MSSAMAKRGEEHLERSGHPIAEEREHPEREGDVGRHGHASPRRSRAVPIKKKIETGGREHATEGGDQRERGFAQGG
jgi:hypothetical protein